MFDKIFFFHFQKYGINFKVLYLVNKNFALSIFCSVFISQNLENKLKPKSFFLSLFNKFKNSTIQEETLSLIKEESKYLSDELVKVVFSV